MLGDSASKLITEFDDTKQLRPDVQKPVWHNSLRLPDGETLSNDQWVNIADDYMKRMGFSDTHLRCYVLHDDPAGQHIHIIASRIDIAGGKLYLGRNENLISTRIISELEIAHGLTVTKTAPSLPNQQPKRKESRNEQMLSERTGLPSSKKLSSRYSIKVWQIHLTFNFYQEAGRSRSRLDGECRFYRENERLLIFLPRYCFQSFAVRQGLLLGKSSKAT